MVKATCPMGDFEAEGENEEEVMEKFKRHAKEAHDLDEIPSDLRMKIQQSMTR